MKNDLSRIILPQLWVLEKDFPQKMYYSDRCPGGQNTTQKEGVLEKRFAFRNTFFARKYIFEWNA